MESIFHSLDCKSNPASGFWQKILNDLQEGVFAGAIYSGNLLIAQPHKGLKSKNFILTKSSIYLLSKWKIPKYKANINWKIVEPFEEVQSGLKRYGFRLCGSDYEDFYTFSLKDLNNWLEKLSQVSIFTSFEEDFITIKELNKGASAIVNLCQTTVGSEEYAVKTVQKSLFTQEPITFNNTISEISILRQLDHPNIVKLFKVYETKEAIHLVLEYLKGGDGLKKLQKLKKFDEKAALKFTYSLISALDYLHSQNIVHRDIKLENIVYINDFSDDFKLVDFGLACKVKGSINGACGTAGFIAPEVLRNEPYSSKVDIFSTGSILYILLTGKFLFTGKTRGEILMKNKECRVNQGTLNLRSISKTTKNFCVSLLNSEPAARYSANEALNQLCIKDLMGVEYLYKIQDCEGFYYDKGNTTDSVNKSHVMRNVMNNNYVHPL